MLPPDQGLGKERKFFLDLLTYLAGPKCCDPEPAKVVVMPYVERARQRAATAQSRAFDVPGCFSRWRARR